MKLEQLMNIYLADLNVFYRKLQNLHWYVQGKGFFTVHKKLEELYDDVNEQIDEFAERILAKGNKPLASMKKYLEVAHIKEREDEYISTTNALVEIEKDYKHLLSHCYKMKELADEENDFGTSAMLDEFIADYEKTLWMIKAYTTEI